MTPTARQFYEATLALSVDDRIDLVMAIWDSIPVREAASAFALSPEQRAELDRRIAEHHRNPSSSISGEEGLARLSALRSRFSE